MSMNVISLKAAVKIALTHLVLLCVHVGMGTLLMKLTGELAMVNEILVLYTVINIFVLLLN